MKPTVHFRWVKNYCDGIRDLEQWWVGRDRFGDKFGEWRKVEFDARGERDAPPPGFEWDDPAPEATMGSKG